MNQQVRALNTEEIVGINTQAENWHVQENQNYFHLAAAQDECRGMPEIQLERETGAKLRRALNDKPGGLGRVTRQWGAMGCF